MSFSLSFDPSEVASLFPFHFVVDDACKVIQIGRGLQKLCPSLKVGETPDTTLRLERPAVAFDIPSVHQHPNVLFVLRTLDDRVRFRGEVLRPAGSNLTAFLISPWLTAADDLSRLGLTIGDFPIHDTSIDLLYFAQLQKVAAQDLQLLNRKLTEQRGALRDANLLMERQYERLQELQAFNQNVLETAPIGIAICDEGGMILEANPAAHEMLGYEDGEIAGLLLGDLIQLPDIQLPGAGTDVEGMANLPVAGTGSEGKAIRKNGESFAAYIAAGQLTKGDRQRFTIIISDLSPLKEAEHRLRQSRDELLASNRLLAEAARLKDEFLAHMSHELRTPLAAILGAAEILQSGMDGSLSSRQNASVGMIQSSGKHLLELINNVLDLARAEAGEMELEAELCSAADICDLSTALIAEEAASKHLHLNYQRPEIDLRGDSRRLKQALQSLLSNAVKFTPDHGQISLEVSCNEAAATVAFTVTDTGVGIRQDQLRQLFAPFSQLQGGLTRRHAGTGLGLSLAHRVAQLHGGSVRVESKADSGSCFTLTVPWLSPSETARRSVINYKKILRAANRDVDLCTGDLMALGIRTVVAAHPGNLPEVIRSRAAVLAVAQIDKWAPADVARLEAATAEVHRLGSALWILTRNPARDWMRQPGVSVLPDAAALFAALEGASDHADGSELPAAVVVNPQGGMHLLIVENTESSRVMVETCLDACGYTWHGAQEMDEAIAALKETFFDAVLLSLQLPGSSGFDAIPLLTCNRDERVASTPVIALSSVDIVSLRENSLAAGALAFIEKPIAFTNLRMALDAVGSAYPRRERQNAGIR